MTGIAIVIEETAQGNFGFDPKLVTDNPTPQEALIVHAMGLAVHACFLDLQAALKDGRTISHQETTHKAVDIFRSALADGQKSPQGK